MTTTFATHAKVQYDGNDFLQYTDAFGNVLFSINNKGNIAVAGGLTTAGEGVATIVASVASSLGFAVFNTAAAVNLLPATAPTGVYNINLYMVTTTTFVGNTEEVITFGYNDQSGAQTIAYTSAAVTAGTVTHGGQLISLVTGTALTYTPSKTGSSASAGVNYVAISVGRVI